MTLQCIHIGKDKWCILWEMCCIIDNDPCDDYEIEEVDK